MSAKKNIHLAGAIIAHLQRHSICQQEQLDSVALIGMGLLQV